MHAGACVCTCGTSGRCSSAFLSLLAHTVEDIGLTALQHKNNKGSIRINVYISLTVIQGRQMELGL